MAASRVVLLGFMASGKTAVGRALAERIGWTHLDFDREIEREAGATVEDLFRSRGEASFRRLEAEITPRLLRPLHTVLTPGGGWITNPGLFDALPSDTLTVWLKVSPEEVLRRVAADPTGPIRPLLQGDEPLSRVRRLLAEREPLYRWADVSVETDGRTTAEIVDELVRLVRGRDDDTNRREILEQSPNG